MSTVQSYYALVSYLRFCAGKTRLYDMSDVAIGDSKPDPTEPEATEPKPVNPSEPNKPSKPGTSPNTGDETTFHKKISKSIDISNIVTIMNVTE